MISQSHRSLATTCAERCLVDKRPMTGTLGTLLRAKRAGLVRTLRPLLEAVITHGLRISPELHKDVLELAGENP